MVQQRPLQEGAPRQVRQGRPVAERFVSVAAAAVRRPPSAVRHPSLRPSFTPDRTSGVNLFVSPAAIFYPVSAAGRGEATGRTCHVAGARIVRLRGHRWRRSSAHVEGGGGLRVYNYMYIQVSARLA